jgi:hypothetical protein
MIFTTDPETANYFRNCFSVRISDIESVGMDEFLRPMLGAIPDIPRIHVMCSVFHKLNKF